MAFGAGSGSFVPCPGVNNGACTSRTGGVTVGTASSSTKARGKIGSHVASSKLVTLTYPDGASAFTTGRVDCKAEQEMATTGGGARSSTCSMDAGAFASSRRSSSCKSSKERSTRRVAARAFLSMTRPGWAVLIWEAGLPRAYGASTCTHAVCVKGPATWDAFARTEVIDATGGHGVFGRAGVA